MSPTIPTPTSNPPPEEATPNPNAAPPKKKSLYQRYRDAKTGRNVQISDADLKKYTGMTKSELGEWSKDRPGVGGNQLAGKLAMGPASGLGGLETAQGYGGWGTNAEGGMKFPPGWEKKEGGRAKEKKKEKEKEKEVSDESD
jgi:hypothetical protein